MMMSSHVATLLTRLRGTWIRSELTMPGGWVCTDAGIVVAYGQRSARLRNDTAVGHPVTTSSKRQIRKHGSMMANESRPCFAHAMRIGNSLM